ncbi:SDR family NAD(P)-dependent oxidoreductase [Streptomyces sp. NPDC059629]|uniref:SDR family NAD(P)-dependent oxidoreductase n=1 Tax=Streptomyces sp. NPDC059629 TaxID=3346889 RepID=UPI0036911BFB
MNKLFEGKRAFVTGGGSGIGRASAMALAAEGCFVTVAGRTEESLEGTVRAITEIGGSAQAVKCDVTVESMVRSAVAAAAGDEGQLDVAVNSAGYDGSASLPTHEWTSEMVEDMLAANVRGTFLAMKYELELMNRQGSGAIVNIGSGAGLLGVPGHAGYVASKHAGIGLTRSAALDYAAKGIRVNAVAPGLVDTGLLHAPSGEFYDYILPLIANHPIGRIAQPSEIADAVVWLASDKSSFVTGVALPVDGGLSAA